MVWGVPGAGKSTFCGWLAKTHGFTHAETDAGASVEQAVIMAQNVIRVVIEYGMWVDRGSTGQVRSWRSLGAQASWFDGDRVAAFQAWKQENARQGRPFPDDLWHHVLAEIDRNWSLVQQCFGANRILRTINAGPSLVPPEEIHVTMQRVIADDTKR